jgi:hypothetical protein
MRNEVVELEKLGPLPDEESIGEDAIRTYQSLIQSISAPVTDQEARVLVSLFGSGDDSCFGLAWTLVHLIESAPGWPLLDCLNNTENWWIEFLQQRLRPTKIAVNRC